MKRICFWSLTAVACANLLAQPLPLRAAAKMSCAGVSLPTQEQAFGVDLVLNGMGIRSVTIFNIRVFVAGLYLERRTQSALEALAREQTLLIVITFLRDADRSRMIDSIRSGIDSQPPRLKQLAQKNLRDLERHLPDPRKGGRMVFAYDHGRLELRENNKVTASWNDPGLAEALFNTWLGQKSVDSDLKKGLLGGACE